MYNIYEYKHVYIYIYTCTCTHTHRQAQKSIHTRDFFCVLCTQETQETCLYIVHKSAQKTRDTRDKCAHKRHNLSLVCTKESLVHTRNTTCLLCAQKSLYCTQETQLVSRVHKRVFSAHKRQVCTQDKRSLLSVVFCAHKRLVHKRLVRLPRIVRLPVY